MPCGPPCRASEHGIRAIDADEAHAGALRGERRQEAPYKVDIIRITSVRAVGEEVVSGRK